MAYLVILVLALSVVGCSETASTDGGGASGGSGGASGEGGVGGDGGSGGMGGAFSSKSFERIELYSGGEVAPWCPDGIVAEATIVREADGGATILGARLAAEADGCVQYDFGPAPVSASDADSLQALIEAVPAYSFPTSYGGCTTGFDGGCDAGLTRRLIVDGESSPWSDCCNISVAASYTEAFLAVIEKIEEISPPTTSEGCMWDGRCEEIACCEGLLCKMRCEPGSEEQACARDDCLDTTEPVCGCDGTVYDSYCEAHRAGVDIGDVCGDELTPPGHLPCGGYYCDATQYCDQFAPDRYRCRDR